ncbi:polyprenyl synthetase family protein [Massilia dura]|uniref:Polyprenyl synthetase family protein n=1 Tax=Pseudoduganella dura TaxID=321982 RepID=A0A6I3X5E9_9BURK|nr:polyprenyl synthetase family protein [Pseudoduganella dura]MUI11417.1 polyprenyl synthetase family protein [Pseudoduganella dura]GGX96040.1 farnesyl diphosphate synthase [Pseudoduganella dura]
MVQTRQFNGFHEKQADTIALRQAVDSRIAQLLGDSVDPLAAAMRAGALGSGKRMRPLLVMLVARDLGVTSPDVLDVACAVELVHASSLILDDMPCMDNARLRRGKPAVHVQFGEDVAILASIALLSRAFCVVSSAQHLAPATRSRLVCTLSETIGAQGLARGQFQDLRGNGQRSADEITTTNELKTGVLLGVAVEMAAVLAQASDAVTQSLRAFAMAAGHAFQIRDDFADGGDSAITGKDTGKDIGKATLVNTLGPAEARRRMGAYVQQAERHLGDALGPGGHTHAYMAQLLAQASPAPQIVPAIAPRPAAQLGAQFV